MTGATATVYRGVPLFPLPDYFLFPGVVAPLHIFEPRYRQMIEDLLDGPGRLVIAAFRPDGPVTEHGPKPIPMGTLAEIVHHERLQDGRFLIWVLGLSRVTMVETQSPRPYRLVDAAAVVESEPEPEDCERLQPRLLAALQRRIANDDMKLSDWGSVGRLADLLLESLHLDADRLARAFIEPDARARADLALAWSAATDA